MLKGKNAIITGGARGIGKSIALMFAKNGANIMIVDIAENDNAKETIKELRTEGVKAEFQTGDVTVLDDAVNAVTRCKEEFGSVDILVNNAGITNDKLILKMTDEDFAKVINVNLQGSFNFLKAASKVMMKQRDGAIINMASVAGVNGNPGQANYSASKAGVIGLTKSAAKELGRRNIRVNAIAPGFIDTDMTRALTDEQIEMSLKAVSLGRAGQPEDVAGVALFLASDLGSYVSGQTISVDGAIIM